MDLRIAITDDLNSEREKLSSAIIAPFSKVGLNVGNIDEYKRRGIAQAVFRRQIRSDIS